MAIKSGSNPKAPKACHRCWCSTRSKAFSWSMERRPVSRAIERVWSDQGGKRKTFTSPSLRARASDRILLRVHSKDSGLQVQMSCMSPFFGSKVMMTLLQLNWTSCPDCGASLVLEVATRTYRSPLEGCQCQELCCFAGYQAPSGSFPLAAGPPVVQDQEIPLRKLLCVSTTHSYRGLCRSWQHTFFLIPEGFEMSEALPSKRNE